MFSNHSSVRRLPIYIILDTSRSMRGEPIRAVNEGLRVLKDALISDPYAIETAHVSIIEYNTEPRQVVPLTEITSYIPPILEAGGWSAMGAALRLLNARLDEEVVLNSADQKGDYKPLIFLMTDGRPTDSWKLAIKALRQRKTGQMGNLIALGCGPKADLEILSQIADVTFSMKEISPEKIQSFFKWISQSVNTVSRSLGKAEEGIFLPPPPLFIRLHSDEKP